MNPKNRMTLLTALFLFLIFSTSEAIAEKSPCSTPDGYTEDGIGGTGHSLPPGGDDEESGIGGTGMQKSAENQKVYVTGTVYAFGSICVNGLHIAYDDSTIITNGQDKLSASDLSLGQVVEVEARRESMAAPLKASEIILDYNLTGTIESVSKDTNRIRVLNETVIINNPDAFQHLSSGQMVYVSGLRDKDGYTVASLIKKLPQGAMSETYGELKKDASGKMTISGTPVTLADNNRLNYLNKNIIARGQWNNGALMIEKAIQKEEETYTSGQISLEGYISDQKTEKTVLICHERFTRESLNDRKYSHGDRVMITGNVLPSGEINAISMRHSVLPSTRMEGF